MAKVDTSQNFSRKITQVLILGNHIQALGLVRLAHDAGLHAELYNDSGACVTRFSRFCKKFHLFKDDENLVAMLLARGSAQGENGQSLLVPTNDRLIGLLMTHYTALSQYYRLAIAEPPITQICFNKRDTYRRAMELGIPIPESHFPDTEAELVALGQNIAYPCILKPAVMFKFHDSTGKKVFLCHNPAELLENYRKILGIIPANEVIVQQFLTGGAASLYSFGSFSGGGKVHSGFLANRIRQKPMDFGISTCYAVTVVDAAMEANSVRLLEGLDYFGMSETEWMQDPITGQFMLLEINPRAWKWHSLQAACGLNLLGEMVRFLNGEVIQAKRNQTPGLGWVEMVTDTFIVAKEVMGGRLGFGEYLKTLGAVRQRAAWAWRDPMPAIMYVAMTPYLALVR